MILVSIEWFLVIEVNRVIVKDVSSVGNFIVNGGYESVAESILEDIGGGDNEKNLYEKVESVISQQALGEELLADPLKILSLHEISAVHDGALFAALSIHYNLCIGTIRSLGGNSGYVLECYRKLVSGEAVGVYLATETAYGNNVISLQTEANYCLEERAFMLNSPSDASFKFMPNTSLCCLPKIAVVMARLKVRGEDFGVVPFLMPLHEDGHLRSGVRVTEIGYKPGFGLDNCITSFDNVSIPYESMLSEGILSLKQEDGTVTLHEESSRKRFLMAMQRVQFGKVCMAVGGLGVGKASLYITSKYGKRRKTFSVEGDVPLVRYHSFSNQLVEYAAGVIVQSFWAFDLGLQAFEYESKRGSIPERLKTEIAISKSLTTWFARDVVVKCRELCGAQGMFSMNKFPGYYAMVNGCITAEGDNLVIMQKAARDLLSTSPELPDRPESPQVADLFDILKENYLSLHSRVGSLLSVKEKSDYFSLWNKASEDMMDMLKSLGAMYAACSAEKSLRNENHHLFLVEIYLLDCIEKLSASMAFQGSVSLDSLRSLQSRKGRLVSERRSEILDLIDQFGLDKVGLKTPISHGDYVEWYSRQHNEGVESARQ
ncbi:acyl-CoA dehydrogenase family protein [Microbulbifer halophilus]|uniref:Acyl-CoA dehydrogenase family protein n=1 Tax=Microbulbifer halophilus TaxID=453963 RepID=A0ABW5EGZ4_9GAMM|nr:acyl-CoA dehydrogenase family protein [Microbulbifer halophilus]MCW8128249.1 hypothetical protein [Microbulbifer halophilus]